MSATPSQKPMSSSYAHARKLVEQADEELATRTLIGPPGPTQAEVLEAGLISPAHEGPDPSAALNWDSIRDRNYNREQVIDQSYRTAERLYLQAANLYYSERTPDHVPDQVEALIEALPAHLRAEVSTLRADFERENKAGADRGWDRDDAFDRAETYLNDLRERLQVAAQDLYGEQPNWDASRSRD